jgi:hypothetical protein
VEKLACSRKRLYDFVDAGAEPGRFEKPELLPVVTPLPLLFPLPPPEVEVLPPLPPPQPVIAIDIAAAIMNGWIKCLLLRWVFIALHPTF